MKMKLAIAFAFAFATVKAQMPLLTATTALPASKATVATDGIEERLKPFDMPAGYTIREITDRRTLNGTSPLPPGFSLWDMVAYAAPENAEAGAYPDGGQYVFIPMETVDGGLLRYSLVDQTYVILAESKGPKNPTPATFDPNNDEFQRIDPSTFTPWGTVIFAEEATGTFYAPNTHIGISLNVRDPTHSQLM
jgi:hypothetical protein